MNTTYPARGDTPYHRLLRARGLGLKSGTKFSGTLKTWIRAEVVDAVTGEDRGERWIRRHEDKWEVVRERPRAARQEGS